MKKKTSFKLLKISSIICIVLTLISFASLSVSASSTTVLTIDPRTIPIVANAGFTRTSMSTPTGIPYARFSSPSGEVDIVFCQKASEGAFVVGSQYILDFKFRTGSNNTKFSMVFSSVPATDSDYLNQSVDILTFDTRPNYTSGEFIQYHGSFQVPQSLNGSPIYIIIMLTSSTGATNLDLTELVFSQYREYNIPDDWSQPSYNLEEPDIANQIAEFENATDTFFVVDWFRQSNPVGNGAKAFLGLFTSVWTQFDNTPWLKLMVTFAIMTSIVGLIVNSAAHIHFKDESYRTYEKNRSRRETYDYHYTHKPPED